MTRASAIHSDVTGPGCSPQASTSTAHECLRLEHVVTDTIDVTLGRVRHQLFQQDGTRHSVFGYVCGFHVVENLPCAIHILRKDASVQVLIKRHPVGADTPLSTSRRHRGDLH